MIVQVFKFGGSRTADPPAWGQLIARDLVEIFAGVPDSLLGAWWIDDALSTAYACVPDEDVPDEVWAALAMRRLTE